jgi:PAS domain S-box-containing protein
MDGGTGWDVDAHLGSAFAAAAVPMAFTTPTGRFRKVNPAYCELTGRTEADLLALTVADVTHPDDLAVTVGAIRALMAGTLPVLRTEKRFVRPDGTIVWGLTNANAVRDAGGSPVGVFAQVLDLTAVKDREAVLTESAERVRFMAEGAADFLVFRALFRPDLHIDFVSSGVQQILGITPAELRATPGLLFEAMHPEDRQLVDADRASPTAARRPKTLRFVRRDGTQVWTYTHTSPILDEDGRVAGVDGIAYDITQRVVAERAVRDSERRFRSLVQNATDLVCLIGPEGTFEYVSPSVTGILGHPVTAVLGQAARTLGHPDDMDALAETMTAIPPGAETTAEFRVRHAGGGWRWLESVIANRVEGPAVGAFVLNARDATEQHRLREELARRANYDQLTGLPNKAHFRDLVAARLTGGSDVDGAGGMLVASVDVEALASIAEVFGYAHADSLTAQVTGRLEGSLPPGAVLGRIGNEDFAVAVPADSVAGAEGLARDMLAAFGDPFMVGSDPFQLDLTVGAAVSGTHGDDALLLLRRAKLARRAAHRAARGYRLYSADLDEHSADRLSLLGQLRDAIGSEQLRLHYQPKLRLSAGTVCGVEALIRWQHPQLGFVAPDRFIGLAERSGLIAPLTRWVVEEAARQSRAWADRGIDLPIAVNITPHSLQDPAFPDEVVDAVRRWRLPASALCLELTERAVTTDPEAAARACRRLAAEGITLSMDDFGTGQSSLAHLAALPVSELKIDMSFVRPLTTSSQAEGIVRMIVDLAHHLDQTATAEGVEDKPTLDLLAQLGCDAIQGYYLSRPLPAAELAAWLSERGVAAA